MTLGTDDKKVTLTDYLATVALLTELYGKISDKRDELTALINSRDATASTLSGYNTRALSAKSFARVL